MLTWREIFRQIAAHRGRLLQANLIALLAVVAAVPVPLLLPLMVDEVLLHHPGAFVAAIAAWTPAAWHGPVLFIGAALLLSLALRLAYDRCSTCGRGAPSRCWRRRWCTRSGCGC